MLLCGAWYGSMCGRAFVFVVGWAMQWVYTRFRPSNSTDAFSRIDDLFGWVCESDSSVEEFESLFRLCKNVHLVSSFQSFFFGLMDSIA